MSLLDNEIANPKNKTGNVRPVDNWLELLGVSLAILTCGSVVGLVLAVIVDAIGVNQGPGVDPGMNIWLWLTIFLPSVLGIAFYLRRYYFIPKKFPPIKFQSMNHALIHQQFNDMTAAQKELVQPAYDALMNAPYYEDEYYSRSSYSAVRGGKMFVEAEEMWYSTVSAAKDLEKAFANHARLETENPFIDTARDNLEQIKQMTRTVKDLS